MRKLSGVRLNCAQMTREGTLYGSVGPWRVHRGSRDWSRDRKKVACAEPFRTFVTNPVAPYRRGA